MSRFLLVLFFLNRFEPIKALKCYEASNEAAEDDAEAASDSYTFVIPENGWGSMALGGYLELGQSIEVSRLCNPNFKLRGQDCDFWAYRNICSLRVSHLIMFGHKNSNGFLETVLQCPQCGCGAEGAANLNDLYVEEQVGSRKVSDVANIMLSQYE